MGRNLLDLFAKRTDVGIVATTRSPSETMGRAYPSVQFQTLDVGRPDDIKAVFARHQPSHVINCAAYGVHPANRDVQTAFSVNATGAMNLFDAAVGTGAARFIHIGTCSEYGPVDGAIPEDTPIQPKGIYAASKAAGTMMLQEMARGKGTELVIVRLFGMWGVHEPAHRLLPSMLACHAQRKPIALSQGTQIRDFSNAVDVAQCLFDLSSCALKSTPYLVNLGSGVPKTVRTFVEDAAAVIGCENALDFGAIEMRKDEVASVVADIARLKELGVHLPPPPSAALFERYLRALSS